MQNVRPRSLKLMTPALTLALIAPMLAEVLPGATRFPRSSCSRSKWQYGVVAPSWLGHS
jgi:hypothetical protein